MANNYKRFLTMCSCGTPTSKHYAWAHGGKCKTCVEGNGERKPWGGEPEEADSTSPDMYSHMGGMCRGDDLGLSPDY